MAKLPSMLNVLTILTYVGCGLGLLGSLYSYFTIQASYDTLVKLNTVFNDLGGQNSASKSMINAGVEMARKQAENRLPILLIALVGLALCFYGAMQMRNLKKQGYLFYVIGELLPIIGMIVLVGVGSIWSGATMIIGFLIAITFVILYTSQRKFLVN